MKNKFSYSQFKKYFYSEKEKAGRRRLYNSLWALLFGVITSVIIITLTGNNPFEVFKVMFQDAINQDEKFVTMTIVFLIATLGTAMCFKSGIFNIGASGQMMAAGMTTVLILKLVGINSGTIVLSVIIALLIGAFLAFIAAMLKAFFRVNEVVSTIMLNWIVFYIIKFIIKSDISGLVNAPSLSQDQTEKFNLPIFFQSSAWIAILIITGIVMMLCVWFVFSKTTFGYKMKMLAMNKDASKYAGTNEKLMLIVIMSISGAFAGLAGFLFYSELGAISAQNEPIAMGFDTIAIALLVYNNPFGVGIASVLFSIIQLGGGSLKALFPPLTNDFAQIMFGIIIYIAAISIVFERFKLFLYIKNWFIYMKDPRYKEVMKEYRKNQIANFKTKISNHVLIKNIKKEKAKEWKKIKQKAISNKIALDQDLASKFNAIEIETKIEKKPLKISKTFFKDLKDILTSMMKQKQNISVLDSTYQQEYFEQISLIKKQRDEELFNANYFEISSIKSEAKNLFQENKNIVIQFKKQILEERNQKHHKENIQDISTMKGSK